MEASLIVTVDTEEEGLWSGRFEPEGNTVENTRGIVRFQALCDRYGVRPTYLVDYPVVEDDRSTAMLREYEESGRCEVGAHLHPWCNPPHLEAPGARSSFLLNLPEPLQRAKVERLTARIQERFGHPPGSFRAGRYGLDIRGARLLADLGYHADSSVIPFSDFSAHGGPDFTKAPFLPYRVGGGDLSTPAAEGFLLEVPVSVGFSRRHFQGAWRLLRLARRRPWRDLRIPGLLDRLGLACRIKLSPEQAGPRRLKALGRSLLRNGAPCLVMLLHSSSLVPGGSPYVPDRRRLEDLYRALEESFSDLLGSRRLASRTLAEFACLWRPERDRARQAITAPCRAPPGG